MLLFFPLLDHASMASHGLLVRHYCHDCHLSGDVYANESHRPQGSSADRCQCRGCRQMIDYAPSLFISKTAILINRGVATLFTAETKTVVSRMGTRASKLALDLPFLNGNKGPLSEKAK